MKAAAQNDSKEIRTLLIEDSSGDVRAIMQALYHAESVYSFHIARRDSLQEGLAYLQDNPADVLLLDLGLPDAKELTAVIEIHKAHPDLPIVVLSGHSDLDTIRSALQNGAQEFLVKGECSGVSIKQSIYQAIARKQLEKISRQGGLT